LLGDPRNIKDLRKLEFMFKRVKAIVLITFFSQQYFTSKVKCSAQNTEKNRCAKKYTGYLLASGIYCIVSFETDTHRIRRRERGNVF